MAGRGTLLESFAVFPFVGLRFLLCLTLLNRVALVVYQLAVLFCPLSGLRKSPVGQWAKPHVACLFVDGVTKYPRLRAEPADLQIQASAVVIEAGGA